MNNSYKVLASSSVVKCLVLEIGSGGLEVGVGAGIKAARHTLQCESNFSHCLALE